METDTTRRFSTRLKPERQRRLMEERTNIKGSLDRIIYPILRIPVEITSEIFLHCLPVDGGRPDATSAPMLLCRICRVWRNIAFANPRLWASLQISCSDWNLTNPILLRDWLRRAGGLPLSLSLALPYVRCPYLSFFDDHWGNLTSFSGHHFDLTQCYDVLLHAPRLIRCEFFFVRSSTPPSCAAHVLLPALEVFALNMASYLDAFLLDSLTLPRLRSLSLTCILSHRFAYISFLSFLQRAPSIQTFSARFYAGKSHENGIIIAMLRAMPVLTSLELRLSSTADIMFDILHHLHESSRFLPHIQKIFFSVGERVPWQDRYTRTLVDALYSRWAAKPGLAQLLDFEFQFCLVPVAALHHEILDCVAKLKDKGMHIYVGSYRFW
ncbi:hypothetical protein MVEN_00075000 [Mycena venus]|uniref:F-box domain-containing protein n=1 Tax=Mycena venus TaxID=2733690 RepID=A0A8H7DE58_9AGAR|nr:hypothetical protein MVEN_00075000 [Mycena venus]